MTIGLISSSDGTMSHGLQTHRSDESTLLDFACDEAEALFYHFSPVAMNSWVYVCDGPLFAGQSYLSAGFMQFPWLLP